MSEDVQALMHEAIEGQLIALQILISELDKSNAIDVERYIDMLLDYRSKHVDGESGTGMVIDRILCALTGEEDMAPLVRRLSLQVVGADNPEPLPRQKKPDRSE